MRKGSSILPTQAADVAVAVAGAILIGASALGWIWYRSRSKAIDRQSKGPGNPPRADDILIASARGIRPKPVG